MLALSDSRLVINIRDRIQAVDGYHYYEAYRTEPRRKFGYSFLFRSSQDFHVQDQAAIRLRLYRRMPTFLCNGRISGMVDRVNAYFHLNFEHSCGHEAAPAVENNAVPQNIFTSAQNNRYREDISMDTARE
ncbi:hypothetical protein BDB00DRAFT_787355 [Zychaea mexicana]|uniref:uncharacterized protein n=1 Tax=Zychaea mexicana TaxID=64656 RepID=UPI0022FE9570|nr:uncharacterized protein BDB00DRAFT_787355 [Zychaea mexicana]KAI9494134.1 hypothetical protein BDB00DRAFT_787355 [Zychaea mexicana]